MGWVKVENSSIIRNVDQIAIHSTHGGIITFNNSTIGKCKVGIAITDYDKHNHKDLGDYENACSIKNGIFRLNELLGYNYEYDEYYCIKLEDLSHIVIESCDFKFSESNNKNHRGTAIYANNASFSLTKEFKRKTTGNAADFNKNEPALNEFNCLDHDPLVMNNLIEGFSDGVNAENLGSLTVGMEYIDFKHCKNSMYIEEGSHHILKDLDVSCTSANYKFIDKTTTNKPAYLSWFEDTQKLMAYNSHFETDFIDVQYLVIKGSGSAPCEVSNCSFENKHANTNSTGIYNTGNCSGYFARCNELFYLKYDWHIASGSSVKSDQVWGKNAGNTHSSPSATYHIYNQGSVMINYRHPTASTLKTSGQVNKINESSSNCPNYEDCNNHPLFVAKPIESDKLEVFPNPSSGSFVIKMPGKWLNQVWQVRLYNTHGQEMVINTSAVAMGQIEVTTQLPKGLYIVRILNQNAEEITDKLLIN